MLNIFKKITGKAGKKEIYKSHIHGESAEENLMGPNKRIGEVDYNDWLDEEYEEGQLSLDVYQTAKDLIIKSTIAGVKPDNIDISINNDMLTIRGKREMDEIIDSADYLYRECYWGAFSRSVILPVEVKSGKINAYLEDGVLTIVLLKAKIKKDVRIKVKER